MEERTSVPGPDASAPVVLPVRAWRGWIGWVVAAVLIALLAGVLWATGGLKKAPPRLGDEYQLGENIDTLEWRVVVTGVTATRTDEYDKPLDAPRLRVVLRATNIADRSTYELAPQIVVVRDPDTGLILTSSRCRRDPRGKFDPLLPARALCDFPFDGEEGEIPQPAAGQRLRLQVVVMDQEVTDGLDNNSQAVGSTPAGYVETEVTF